MAGEDINARAQELGHVGLDEWIEQGKPEEKWRDAEAFVEFHDKLNPVLQKANKELKRQLDELTAKYNGVEGTVAVMAARQAQQLREEFEAKEAYYKTALREARKTGDFDTAASVEEQLDDLKSKAPPKPTAAPEPAKAPNGETFDAEGFTPSARVILNEWIADGNEWWNDNTKLRKYAQSVVGDAVRKEMPSLFGRAFIEEVGKRVRADWPDQFREKPEGNGVEAPTGGGQRSSKKLTYERLDPITKAECDSFVKQKLGTREKYLSLLSQYDTQGA
jgi:hypothetical protein